MLCVFVLFTFFSTVILARMHMHSLKERKWTDEDLIEDMGVVQSTLCECNKVLSAYERYVAEVTNAQLDGPRVHNELFWRENATKFEEDNFYNLKKD